ncbi:MAG: 23S rRNA (adenine(2503)-C(2))-methyltransferase RlmN, partial [Proteobacteria bacterium]|nr:23S rRNA (adenine(2503)-C(2))-methyltransferase RlmN [Pseudomonadota bacterium]
MSNPQFFNLLNYSQSSLARFLSELDESPERAKTLVQYIHQKRILDFDRMDSLNNRLRSKLKARAILQIPELINQQQSQDGSYKWLLRLHDGNAIETVYIPEQARGTLCISSQVGCGLNCRFCATAQAGFNRNLTTAEIIGQLWWAWSRVPKISNVVMMGMGEPLLNYEAVIEALNLMMDHCAYGLSKYRVTVSTAGLAPAMKKLRQDSPVSLAVSLHAPNNALRSQLVPLNKKYPLEELLPICRDYFPSTSKQVVLFEYVLLSGVNDNLSHAKELAELLEGIRCKVNLIPFNSFPGAGYTCPSDQQVTEFQEFLI